MDCKIHFGLYCVILLLVYSHAPGAATQTNGTASGTIITNGTAPGTTLTNGTAQGTTLTNGTSNQHGTHTEAGGSGGSQAPTPTTTTPTPINCNDDVCNSSCSTFTAAKTCQTDTSKGCKVEKTTPKGIDTYTFSCSTSACDSSVTTVDCCFKDKCNPLAESKKSEGTTMFGNLVSITIIVMLAYYM